MKGTLLIGVIETHLESSQNAPQLYIEKIHFPLSHSICLVLSLSLSPSLRVTTTVSDKQVAAGFFCQQPLM